MIVLLTLIFGVIEVSWSVYAFHWIANSAHEGARYAIVRGNSWTGSCASFGSSQCKASTTDIANYVASRGVLGISIDPTLDVCVQYFSTVPSSTSTTCTANTSPNGPGNIVQVTVTHPFTLNIPGVPTKTFNLKSTSQMVIAQ